jgi:histidine triad (HIT) family protein
MSFALPLDRLRETDTLVAFHHPEPKYPLHILLVPKRKLASLTDIEPSHADFVADLFQTVRSLIDEFDLTQPGYRLIANGGAFQDIPLLHFHLISGQ